MGFGYGHSVGTGNVASVASILLILVSIAVGRELQVSSLYCMGTQYRYANNLMLLNKCKLE